jgi:addiction module RelE/StbE family toxin
MMNGIRLSKNFQKQYKLLVRVKHSLKLKIEQRVDLFVENRNNPLLQDHALVGSMKGLRSFSISGDIRIIYKDESEISIFEEIGTHNQVY